MLLKAVFWDLDGTLIDSEPLWHDGEIEIAHNNGGEWNEDLGWECSGTPVPHVAEVMIAYGCTLSVPEIDKQLKDYVFKAEVERLPWIPGVLDVLHSLKEAGVPSMLVTTSPRRMAENIMKQSEGLFAGYVCGDDPYEHKPNPAPYLAAADKLGIAREDMAKCVNRMTVSMRPRWTVSCASVWRSRNRPIVSALHSSVSQVFAMFISTI